MYRFLSLSTIRFYHKALTGLLLSAWVVGSSHAAIYHIDPTHTNVRFAIDHFKTSTNTGGFYNLTGQLEYDPEANIGNVSLIIPLNSLMTGDTIVRLTAALEQNPHVGLIQTLPMIVNAQTGEFMNPIELKEKLLDCPKIIRWEDVQ